MWWQVESALKPLLDAYFSPLSGVQVLAQPGNFYVASAFCLAIAVISKKMVNHHWDNLAQGVFFDSMFFFTKYSISRFLTWRFHTGENNEGTEFLYYMNEGVYGPFSCKLLGNSISAPSVHKVSRSSRFSPVHTLLKHQIALLFSIGKWVTHLEKQGQSWVSICIIED